MRNSSTALSIIAKLNTFGTISDDATTYHNDYGIPAVFMILESGGQDLVALVDVYKRQQH